MATATGLYFLHMGTIVVFKQELGRKPRTIHILNSKLRKNTEIYLHNIGEWGTWWFRDC